MSPRSSPGPSRFRRLVWTLAILLGLLLLSAVTLALAWGSASIRQRALAEANRWAQREWGLSLEVRDVSLYPLAGEVVLDDFEIAAVSGERFLAAERLALSVSPGSLLRGAPRVRRAEIQSAVVDLARVPPAWLQDTGVKPDRAAIKVPDVDRLAVRGLSVRSLSSILGIDWLETAELVELRVAGQVARQRLDLELEGGRLEIGTSFSRPLVLALSGHVSRAASGELTIDRFGLTSEELSLRLNAGGSDARALSGDYRLEVDPGSILSDQAQPANVRASGRFDLGQRAATLKLEASNQTLAPFGFLLDSEVLRRELMDEATFDLEAELELVDGESAGELRWLLRRRGVDTLQLVARPRFSLDELSLTTAFEAAAYPGRAGARRISGRVRVPQVRTLENAAIENGKLALEIPDLDSELGYLRQEWPELLPAELYRGLRSSARGSLLGHGTVTGRLVDPRLAAQLAWKPTSAATVTVSADVSPIRTSGSLDAHFEDLPAELFAAKASGILAGRSSLAWSGSTLSAAEIDFEVEAPVLSWAGQRVVESLSLGVRSTGGDLVWEATGRSPVLGPLACSGAVAVELPIKTAQARMTGFLGPPELSSFDLEARLQAGVLQIATREPAVVFDSTTTAEAALPLRTLAQAVPALEDLLDEGSLLGGEGPIVATVEVEMADWAKAVKRLTGYAVETATAGGRLAIALDPDRPELAEGMLTIDGLEVASASGHWKAADSLVARLGGGTIDIEPWRVSGESAQVELSGSFVLSSGSILSRPLADLLASGRGLLVAELGEAAPGGLESLTLPWHMREDRFEIVAGRFSFREDNLDDQGSLAAAFPISGDEDGRPFKVQLAVPAREWRAELERRDLAEGLDSLIAGVEVELSGELDDPLAARGRVVVPEFRASLGDRTSELETPLTLSIGGRRIVLDDGTLETAGELFAYRGSLELAERWSIGDGWKAAISRLEMAAQGRVDGAMINPLLLGGVASGPIEVDISLAGGLDDLQGRARLAAESGSIIYREPYVARFSAPDIELAFRRGTVELRRGSFRLNEGEATLSGVILDGDGGTDLRLTLRDANFRLDYGLIVQVDSELRYRSPIPEDATFGMAGTTHGKALISGRIDIDRGYLTRRINLDVELLTQLLAPMDLTSTTGDPLEEIALDLELATREGVRVKNNVADLLAGWDPISVRGNLLRPVLEGEIEVEPGGLVHLYGQTVRLDRASLTYPGASEAEPRLNLETTTSLEDPSIGKLEGNDPFSGGDDSQQAVVGIDELTGDLASYYGEQLAQRLSESLDEIQVSLRAVLVFGETDPSTRLTVSRDFSPNVALAASVDLRNAESQTYVLDVHELRRLPGFVGQTFTDDENAYGGSLFQKLGFGGTVRRNGSGPRIGRIRIPKLAGTSKRGLKRNLGLEKGDRLAPGAAFAAEVELIEYLRRRGFPSASARVVASPQEGGDRVEVRVELDTGPQVGFRFEGEKIPQALHESIRDVYRVEAPEGETLGEVRAQVVRVLRSRGFLDPQVEVEMVREDSGDRSITVRSVGGVRIEPQPPVFVGLSAEDAEVVGRRFAGPVQRVELAMGLPQADQRLIDTLVRLGYPSARIVRRWSDQRGKGLKVEVEPGARRRIQAIEWIGVDGKAERTKLTEALSVAAGDPARGDLLALSVLEIEHLLEEDGYGDARVTLASKDLPGKPLRTVVSFEVDKGERKSVGAVDFDGLRASRESWASRVIDLETGDPLGPSDLNLARRNLLATGVFSLVSPHIEPAATAAESVVFEVEERDHYELAYGLRWRSEHGLSAVVDATNRNLLGRGATAALRALYRSDDQSLRGLLRMPRARSHAGSFELFASIRSLVDSGIMEDIREATVQYSRPVGKQSIVRVYGRYRDTELAEEDPDPFFPLDERIRRPLFGAQYIFDSRSSDPIHPLGTFVSVDLSGSDESFGDFGFARVFSQLRYFRSLGLLAGGRVTWGQSLQVGAAEAFGDLFLLPLDRFRAGGEYSVRGYAFESLGPENPKLFASESAVLVLSQELRWEAWKVLSPVAFVDVGNIYENLGDFGKELFASIGVGARALTPVGLLRLDLAHALDRRSFDPEFKLYLGLGTSF